VEYLAGDFFSFLHVCDIQYDDLSTLNSETRLLASVPLATMNYNRLP
jgi:hypothetical protein